MPRPKKNKAEYLVGVDFGGTKILAGVLSPEGQVIAREKMRTKAERDPLEVVQRIITCINRAIDASRVPRNQVLALGIGAPGPLNPDTGVLEAPPNLKGWQNVPIKTILEKHLNLRVNVENDVNAGTYGEYRRGAGIGARDVVGIFIGTGIGGGLILNGSLYRGFNQTAGEIGHIKLQPNGGPICGCGDHGCYEAMASRLAVVRRIYEIADGKPENSTVLAAAGGEVSGIRSKHLVEGWKSSDKATVTALTEMARYTGLAMAGIINLLNPELFILGGGVMEALGKEMIGMMEKEAIAHAMPMAARNIRIRLAMLGDDAVLIGAALLAKERFGAQPRKKVSAKNANR